MATNYTSSESATDPTLPEFHEWLAEINAQPGLVDWFEAEPEVTTADGSGLIAQITTMKTAGAATLSQSTGAAKPTLDNDGGPDGGPVINLGVATPTYLNYSAAGPTTSFTKIVAFKINSADLMAVGQPGELFSTAASSGMSIMRVFHNATAQFSISAQVGAAGSAAVVSSAATMAADQWNLAILSYDDATKEAAVSIDGGVTWVKNTNVSVAVTQTALTVSGASKPFGGAIRSLMLWSLPLHLTPQAATLALLRKYFVELQLL